MKKLYALFGALAFGAAAATLPANTPLVEDGPIKVDMLDLDAFMLKVPENLRPDVRASYDRVASVVDSVFVTRVAAARAREAGLDKDPAVQRRLQQVQEGFLAELYIDSLQKGMDSLALEKRARELYNADPKQFQKPEGVYVQQIIVTTQGRTRDMALARAQEAYREAADGKTEFLQLAAKYSDDPDKVRNGGDLGYYAPKHFPAPVADAIAKLDKKGQLAGPIEVADGFHIVRFVSREPAKQATFDEVKNELIKSERARLKKEKVDAFLAEVRGSKTVVIHRDAVESYVVPVDMKSEKAAEPAAAPAKKPADAKPAPKKPS